MFAKDLDVDLLDLGPESCQVIDVQEHFNARRRQELGMATKSFPPSHQVESTQVFKRPKSCCSGKTLSRRLTPILGGCDSHNGFVSMGKGLDFTRSCE